MEREPNLMPEQELNSAAEHEINLPEGVSCVHLRLEASPGTSLTIKLEATGQDGHILARQTITLGDAAPWDKSVRPGRAWRPVARALSLARALPQSLASVSAAAFTAWLMWASLGLYALVRLIGLPDFPVYFFTDEAVQTVLAADFLRDGLRSTAGEILPTFFQNGAQYNLSTSVYWQVIPYYFFGKSIWVTRGAAALATLLAAVSVGLILKDVFKSPYPWLAVLFLSITPVWFLHSRTAFETAFATSFYAAFLYCYLMYRKGSPHYLIGAVVFGTLTFYSYSPARVVILLTGLLLFFSDILYHWSQRKLILAGFGLALLLALPFARFLILHPEASAWQMRLLGSIWVADVPLLEKVDVSLQEYLHGLSPLYWYPPHNLDLPRHTMLGYGHLLRPALPLGLLGVILALRHIGSFPYRTLIIAILAAPAGAALVQLGITRAMTMVIPMAILTALAASALFEWVLRRWDLSPHWLALAVFLTLAAGNLFMLRDSLVNGPLWYRDYGLTGMQYGARQIFSEIAQYLEERPDTKIVMSPSWANGADVIARFFFRDRLPFEMGSAEGYYSTARPLAENQLFIMIPEEYEQLPFNLFSAVTVEKILPYPDGQPGFYFVRLSYAPDIGETIAQDLAERRRPGSLIVPIDGEDVRLSFTRLDMGEIEHLFDGDPHSLVRTHSVNPMQLGFDFSTPRLMKSLVLRVGGTATRLTVQVWEEGQAEPVELLQNLEEATMPRDVELDLPEGKEITRLVVEILNINDSIDGHVHLWEVTFK